MLPHLKESIRRLQEEATANQYNHREYTPLAEQIKRLIAAYPPAALTRVWLMSEFIAKLSGKYRDKPHPQHVATALRESGWESKRLWGSGYAGRRVWVFDARSKP